VHGKLAIPLPNTSNNLDEFELFLKNRIKILGKGKHLE
jgi:hypothetical protein